MNGIENFDDKINLLKSELEKSFDCVEYLKTQENITKKHFYNCDNRTIVVDNYNRVFELKNNKLVRLAAKIEV